jgi:hypothetical protein
VAKRLEDIAHSRVNNKPIRIVYSLGLNVAVE